MTDHEDLKAIIRQIGAAEVARMAGMRPQTLNSWMTGKAANMRTDNFDRVLKATRKLLAQGKPDYETSRAALKKVGALEEAIDNDPDFYEVKGAPGGNVYVPVYNVAVSAGAGAFTQDGPARGGEYFQARTLKALNVDRTTPLAIVNVVGDSMAPTLLDGDHIMIDRSASRITREGIYILLFDDTLMVKRCARDPSSGDIIASSDNKLYQPFSITQTDKMEILGRVIWVGRKIG